MWIRRYYFVTHIHAWVYMHTLCHVVFLYHFFKCIHVQVIKDWFSQWSKERAFTLFFCVLWSKPLSFILIKPLTVLRGFRDTTFDLHLAEHKWVKRNYNTEQSPLLTPPGACRLFQSVPALFTLLSVSSTLQKRLPSCFNGVGHQVLLKIEKKTCIDLKMPCSVILKSFHLYFSSLSWRVPQVMVGEFRKCFAISVFFIFIYFYLRVCVCVYVCALMHVSNLVSCRIRMRR